MASDEDEIEKYYGEWLLLFGDEIVNHSPNLEDILRFAEEFPLDEVTITRAPPLLHDIKITEE